MIPLFSPWFWLAALLSALALLGIGYHQGHENGKNGCLADQASALESAIKQAQTQAIKQAKAELQVTRELEAAREKVRTVYVRIKEKADENIDQNSGYGDCGLDADGLRLYNAKPAAQAPNQTATSIINLPLSGSAGSARWPVGDPVAQQPGAIPALLRMSGETQGALGMGHPSPGEDR
jgi:hypothetical protein